MSSRRDLLQIGAALTAGAVVAQEHHASDNEIAPAKKVARFFKPNEMELLAKLVDRIIPRSDTPGAADANATAAARKPVAPAAPLTPAPYRVTIKLPAADPSSPAEAVTDALRAAGVAFEVETIERVPAGADVPMAPVRSPAPAPR